MRLKPGRAHGSDKPTLDRRPGGFRRQPEGKDAQILGRFKGEIELTGRLVLGEGARCEAKVVADAAEIAGEFKGDLKVRSLVLLEKAPRRGHAGGPEPGRARGRAAQRRRQQPARRSAVAARPAPAPSRRGALAG